MARRDPQSGLGEEAGGSDADSRREKLQKTHRRIHQLERELDDERALFDSVLEHSPQGIVLVDRQAAIARMNPAAEEIWGGQPEEVDHLSGCPIQETLREKRSIPPCETEIERLDGSRAVVLCSTSPVFRADGSLRGGLAIFSEITDLRRIEQAQHNARKSAEQAAYRMTQLQTVTSELFEALTPEQAVETAVKHAKKLLEADRAAGYLCVDEQTIEAAAHIAYDDQLDRYRSIDLDMPVPPAEAIRLSTGIYVSEFDEFLRRYPNLAERRDAEPSKSFAAVPLLDHGEAVGSLLLGYTRPQEFPQRDRAFLQTLADQCAQAVRRAELYRQAQRARENVSRRADQQEAVAELARRALESDTDTLFREALETLVDLLEADTVKLLEYEDDSTLTLRAGIGWDEQWMGKNLGPADDDTAIGHALLANEVVVIEDLRHSRLRPTELVRAHDLASAMSVQVPGRRRPFGAIGVHSRQPRRFTQEDTQFIRGISNVLSDAIEKERAEKRRRTTYRRLSKAMRDREELLSVVSHDLRSPASVVKMNLGLIERHVEDLEGPSKSIEVIRESIGAAEGSIDRMVEMMTNLLELAREDEQRDRRSFESVEFGELLEEAFARLDGEVATSGSSLVVDIEEGLHGRCDPIRFEQIVANLLSNAFKYGEGQPIEVELHGIDSQVELVVRDYGIGISPRDRETIFEQFERADDDERPDSFGLGLWIVKRSVESLEGTIDLESTPGEGTTFRVRLPRDLST